MAESQPLPSSSCAARAAMASFFMDASLAASGLADALAHGLQYQPHRHPPEIAGGGRLPVFRHVELEGGGKLSGMCRIRAALGDAAPFLHGVHRRGGADGEDRQ